MDNHVRTQLIIDALRAAEWQGSGPSFNTQAGPAPSLACTVCKGVNRHGLGSSPEDGHAFWCPVAEALKALGQEVSQQEPMPSYSGVVATLRERLEQDGPSAITDELIEKEMGKYVSWSLPLKYLVAKIRQELGIAELPVSA